MLKQESKSQPKLLHNRLGPLTIFLGLGPVPAKIFACRSMRNVRQGPQGRYECVVIISWEELTATPCVALMISSKTCALPSSLLVRSLQEEEVHVNFLP